MPNWAPTSDPFPVSASLPLSRSLLGLGGHPGHVEVVNLHPRRVLGPWPRPLLCRHLQPITNIRARDSANEDRDHWSNTALTNLWVAWQVSTDLIALGMLFVYRGVRSNVGLFDWVSVTRGDDRDDTLTQLITAPLTFVTASSNSRTLTVCGIISDPRCLLKLKLTVHPTSRSGIIKSSSKVPVSGVKGNMSYKITNTFITHLTEKTVNTICVKRFLKRQEFCIFSRVGSQCLLLRV